MLGCNLRSLGLLIGINLLIVAAHAQTGPTQPILPDRQALFAWFDTLNPAENLTKPFVRFETWQGSDGSARHHERIGYGILLESKGDTFKVLTTDLAVRSLSGSDPVDGREAHTSYTPLDLRTITKSLALTRPERALDPNHPTDLEALAQQPVAVLLLARMCRATGADDLSRAAFARFKEDLGQFDPPGRPNLRELKSLIADDLMRSIVWDCCKGTASWMELRDRDAVVATYFPPGESSNLAKSYLPQLDLEGQEEQIHNRNFASSIEQLPLNQKVRELIYELRDQRGTQGMHPGYCDVFADPRWERSPANQLVEIGFPAVPLLMQELDDQRLSRCSAWDILRRLPDVELRMKDVAVQVLGAIKACNSHNWYATPDSLGSWWKKIQTVGYRQVLIDDIEAGGNDATDKAVALAKQFPDSAFDALSNALRSNRFTRNAPVIDCFADLSDQRVVPFLRELMRDDKNISNRIAATLALGQTNDDEAATALMHEWTSMRQLPPSSQPLADDRTHLENELLLSGRPQAVELVDKDIRHSLTEEKLTVLEVFLPDNYLRWPRWRIHLKRPTDPNVAVAYDRAVETLLAHMLSDNESLYEPRPVQGVPYGLRVGDWAAAALAAKWPNRYKFDPAVSEQKRNRQRIVCLNTWRSSQGPATLRLRSKSVR